MERGLAQEPKAREAYEERGNKVSLLGVVINPKTPWFPHSPDGIVADKGILVEVKVPKCSARLSASASAASLPYIECVGDTFVLKKQQKYYGQVQLGMALLNLCAIYVYIPLMTRKKKLFMSLEMMYGFRNSFLNYPVSFGNSFYLFFC